MNQQDDIIRMAREAGARPQQNKNCDVEYLMTRASLEHLVALATAAEREEAKWDVHSCGPTCTKPACVAIREAVAAERKACEALHDHEAVMAPIGNSAWGEAYQDGWGQGTAAYREAIRARGQA